jgi:hypothetical protein
MISSDTEAGGISGRGVSGRAATEKSAASLYNRVGEG